MVNGSRHRLWPDDASYDCVGVCLQFPSLQAGLPCDDDKELQAGLASNSHLLLQGPRVTTSTVHRVLVFPGAQSLGG